MKWNFAFKDLCDKNMPRKLKGNSYRVAVRPYVVRGGVLATSQECSHPENEGGGDEDVAIDVWVYQDK